MTSLVRPIDLDLLDRRADARSVDDYQVRAIANSMGDVGQLSAIRVRPKAEGRFEIMAGVHRVEACRLLGLAEVDAIVENIGELFAELTMIDENLCRSDLGPSDRARQTARRKQIYEEIHPETVHGATGGGHDQSRQVGDSAPRFTEDTAQASGKSERTVQRDAERGEKISPDVLELVRGTELDTGTYLDGLKKFGPDQQRMLVERDLAAMEAGEVNGARAIAARRQEPADSLDYFPTPPWATRALIEIVLPMLGLGPCAAKRPGPLGRLWEPACGEGHMSGVLIEYSDDVVATDIMGYGSAEGSPPAWIGRHDFLDAAYAGPTPPADWIITNPPFADMSLQFALRALGLAQEGVALFVRQQWLEGVGRYGELFSKYPPALVAQFAERVNLKKGEWDPDGDTLTAYCWVVWIKDEDLANGDTSLMWIPPGQREALTRPDDIERFTAHPVRAPNSPEIPDSSTLDSSSQAAAEGDGDDATGPHASEPAGEVAKDASPAASLSSEAINQLIREGYAAGGVDLVKRLASATGLERAAVRQRAKRMGLADAQHQRDAARVLMTARHHGEGPAKRLAASPERGADGRADA